MKKEIAVVISLPVLAVLIALGVWFFPTTPFKAADSRTISEGPTNILAIGIDQRDFDVIRFYLRGNKVLEVRADDILHQERPVIRPPLAPNRLQERSNLLEAIRVLNTAGDFTAVTAPLIVSNLVRLQQIDERLR